MKLKVNETLSCLIVDDEEEIRETLKMFLESMEVFTFIVESPDGSDAYRKTQNQKFDIIITDLVMPKSNGLDFLQSYIDKNPNPNKTSLIVLSGNLTGLEVKKAMAMGLKHVFTKPCTAQTFVDKVAAVLKKEHADKIVL